MLYLKCKCALEGSSLWVIQKRMNYFSGNYLNHTKSHKELYSGEHGGSPGPGWGGHEGGTTRRRKEPGSGLQGRLGC